MFFLLYQNLFPLIVPLSRINSDQASYNTINYIDLWAAIAWHGTKMKMFQQQNSHNVPHQEK